MFHARARFRRLVPSQQWERNVWVVIAAIFVSFSGFTIVMPFLPIYVQELGVRDPGEIALWSGVIFGVSPLLAGLMAPVWGSLADRFGHKAMFVRSLVVFFFIALLMGFATSVVQLFLLRILWGIFGGMGVMAITMISTSAPEAKSGAAIGRLQAAQLLTNASGPLFGGVLASTIGIRRTFLVSACLYGASLASVVFLYNEPAKGTASRRVKQRLPLRKLVLLPALVPLAGVLFLSQFVDRSINALLPLYLAVLGTSAGAIALWAGVMTSVAAVISAFAASTVGRLSASRSSRGLLLASLVGGAVAALALAVVQNAPQLFAARLLLGLLAGGTTTLAFTLGNQLLPRDSRGASFGLISTGSMLGGGLSPVVAGAIATVNLRWVYITGAVLFAASALIALRLPSRGVSETDAESVGGDVRQGASAR